MQRYGKENPTPLIKKEKYFLIYAIFSTLEFKFAPMTKEMMKIINLPETEFFAHHMHLGTIEAKTHYHAKGQLLYAEGGIIHVFVEEKHWYLPARCFMWIPPNRNHSILTNSRNGDLYNFYFDSDESDFYNEPDIYFANDLLREMILYTRDWEGIITEKTPSKYFFLKALKANLPQMESNKLPITIQHPFPKEENLIKIARFLTQNLEKNNSLDDIAKEFGYSTRTLSRKFKEKVGMSYVRFLRSLRITKSLQLIAENQYNMYEIAMQVGYNSLSSFSTIFSKVMGMTPSDYKQMISTRKAGK